MLRFWTLARRDGSGVESPDLRAGANGSPLDPPARGSATSACHPQHQTPVSDLKITSVEAIYLRLPEVKSQCDSGQDALIVKVGTDAGIVGFGEVDSSPMAAKGCIEGPYSH